MITLCTTNQKGGIGKSTTVANLAHWFAMKGLRVLIMDMDGQGHQAPLFRVEKSDGLYRLLVGKTPMKKVVQEVRTRVHLVTNDHTSEMIKSWAMMAPMREYQVAKAIEAAQFDYDLCFLDTPPSTDLLHVSALVAADYVLIPAKMDFLALDGVQHVIQTLATIGDYQAVEPPTLIGVLPTMFDRTTKETDANVERVQQLLSADLVMPPIPVDTKIREAASYGETIWEYAPESQSAIGIQPRRGAKLVNSRGRIGGYLHAAEIVDHILRNKH